MPLTVNTFVSDGSVLLAFDMPQPDSTFAGFAIQCTPKGGEPYYLLNRLNFTNGVSKTTTPAQRVWTTSDKAPFQKYYWLHFPPEANGTKQFDYKVTAMYFQKGYGLKAGDSGHASVDLSEFASRFAKFTPGFTRGYLSSQAYATGFHNAAIRPAKKSIDFSTQPFEKQYEWLGYSARKLVFDFLNECLHDKSIHVDLFAYDLDEPDFIRGIVQLGKEKRLRAFLDDAPLHTKAGAMEIPAKKAILGAAGTSNVVTGHFGRFAHNKVMIQKRNGQAVKVLTGSANFSIRGLYVQANNLMLINDPKTAAEYEQAFDLAFTQQQKTGNSNKTSTAFKAAPIAQKYFDCSGPGLPNFQVSFSPHKVETVSLQAVADAIKGAKSSVIFAVMQLGGGGAVLQQLSTLNKRTDIFAYGMTQSAGGMTLFHPGSDQHGEFAAFSYLSKHVPPPFNLETSGGAGQVIHDKFVVIDFNGAKPAVFTGSSNLAKGGEEANGDNLLAIYDAAVATGYAVEGIRLVDHYHFRMLQQQHSDAKPVTLQGPGAAAKQTWFAPYYDKNNVKYTARMLFGPGGAKGNAAKV
jgi:phosphatidylserine/phosphatidylglycerophosphate/cardiolipin synthase-like enzyme